MGRHVFPWGSASRRIRVSLFRGCHGEGKAVGAAGTALFRKLGVPKLIRQVTGAERRGAKATRAKAIQEARKHLTDPKKFDPTSLKGLSSNDIRGMIPSTWTTKASKSGGGTVFVDPVNKGRQIRIMPGYPAGSRPDKLTWGLYVEICQNGKTIKLPLEGNPTL